MKPSLLIASPQMKDPHFERTVVLLWHHDEQGAVGVVVNRPLDHSIAEVLAIEEEDMDLSPYEQVQLIWGGPVETDSGTVVTRGDVGDAEGWTLEGGIGVTRSQDALIRLISEQADLRLCLGYAGWGPGQLDQEIEKGGWLWTDLAPELIFSESAEGLYERALATLGLTPHMVWMQPIDE